MFNYATNFLITPDYKVEFEMLTNVSFQYSIEKTKELDNETDEEKVSLLDIRKTHAQLRTFIIVALYW